MILHPEWNPAVIEQQIGGVDRLNSRWVQGCQPWLSGDRKAEMARIAIHTIVFSDAYDDHNRSVLNKRWTRIARPASRHGNPRLVDMPGRINT